MVGANSEAPGRRYPQSQAMPPSVTAVTYNSTGDDSLATPQLPLRVLRISPSASAIRMAARLISRGGAPFFRRFRAA